MLRDECPNDETNYYTEGVEDEYEEYEYEDETYKGMGDQHITHHRIPETWYTIIGVHPSSQPREVRSAYRKKLHLYHPDKGGDQAKFIRLQQAWEEYLSKTAHR